VSYPAVGDFSSQACYIRNASAACVNRGCQAAAAAAAMDQAREIYVSAERMLGQAQQLTGHTPQGEHVSQALWCDAGEHAFSARDPKAERWDRTMKNEEGEPVTIPWDVCGECLAGTGNPGFGLKERHEIMAGKDSRTR